MSPVRRWVHFVASTAAAVVLLLPRVPAQVLVPPADWVLPRRRQVRECGGVCVCECVRVRVRVRVIACARDCVCVCA